MTSELADLIRKEGAERLMPVSWHKYITNKLELLRYGKEFRFDNGIISFTEKYLILAFKVCIDKGYSTKKYTDDYNEIIRNREIAYWVWY